MNIAVIGMMGSSGAGSYAMRISVVLSKTHTSYAFPTQNYDPFDADGMIVRFPISMMLGKHLHIIEYIIVVQSKIFIHNDTDIPLLLFKTENVVPEGTVDNPNIVIKKLERLNDYDKYEHVVASAIAGFRYDSTQEKDVMLLDVPWLPLPFEEYIDQVAKAQYLIVMQRYHDIDTYTCRVIEAMACKTIPIIFYKDPNTKKMYEKIGIDESVAYFVSVEKYGTLQIREYDVEMAERGHKLVMDVFNMNYHASKFMELLLENG